MPWTFRLTLAFLAIFVAGALLIAFACFSTGWEAIGRFVWGMLVAGTGLAGSAIFSLVCAATNQRWRAASTAILIVSVLLFIALLIFAKFA